MDEILRVALTTTGALSIIIAGVYAAVRVIRQDKQWEKLIEAKDAEIYRLRRIVKGKDEELTRLGRRREVTDEDSAGMDQSSTEEV